MRSKLPDQIHKDGLLEKEQIKWFSLTNMNSNKKKFRVWYHSVLKLINTNKGIIEEEIKKHV